MYNEAVEESMIATAEEVQDQSPRTHEQIAADERQKAVEEFNAVIATKPGKAAIKAFLNTKCTGYLTTLGQISRKQRRIAARQVAKRLAKKVMAGEEIF